MILSSSVNSLRLRVCDNLFNMLLAAGSTNDLKRELSAFDEKVSRMERSMQQVCNSAYLISVKLFISYRRHCWCFN